MSTAGPSTDDRIQEGQPLVQSLALKIRRNLPVRVDLDDLIAYGQLGLVQAAKDFDPNQGTRFTTYAFYRVRGAIYDGLSKMTWMSRSQYHRIRYQQMANETLSQENRDSPPSSDATIESEAHWLRQITEKLALVYLVSQTGEGGTQSNLEDSAAAPPSIVAGREMGHKLHELVSELPNPTNRLIQIIYFEGATLQEAANRLGISKSWASRLHAKTLEDLARSLRRLGASD